MAEATTTASAVPVLFVSEPIVLPGMVVPIELDDAARAASTRLRRATAASC